jgi:hypothetical protein
MGPELELYFCDLCNSSVPEADLQSGRARRAGERLVGACCLAQLAPAPASQAGPAAPPAARASAAPFVVAGVVLLAAIAASAMFLDWRMNEDRGWTEDQLSALAGTATGQASRLAALEVTIGGLATSDRIARLGEAQAQIGQRLDEVASALEAARQAEAGQRAQGGERLERLATVAQEQALRLGTIEAELARLAGEVASANARPRATPVAADVSPDMPADGPAAAPAAAPLPPALAHEIERLKDADAGVRFDAVDKLLQSKDPRILPALLTAARDPDLFVRRFTLDGLAGFRHVDTVDALIEALADPQSIVRDTAYGSLRTMTGQKFPFDAEASKAQLAAAQRKWIDWWKDARASF